MKDDFRKICAYCGTVISNPNGRFDSRVICEACLTAQKQLALIAEALKTAYDLTNMTIRKTFLTPPVTDEGKRLHAQLLKQRDQLASLEREIS